MPHMLCVGYHPIAKSLARVPPRAPAVGVALLMTLSDDAITGGLGHPSTVRDGCFVHGPDGDHGLGLREEVRGGSFADEGGQQEKGKKGKGLLTPPAVQHQQQQQQWVGSGSWRRANGEVLAPAACMGQQ